MSSEIPPDATTTPDEGIEMSSSKLPHIHSKSNKKNSESKTVNVPSNPVKEESDGGEYAGKLLPFAAPATSEAPLSPKEEKKRKELEEKKIRQQALEEELELRRGKLDEKIIEHFLPLGVSGNSYYFYKIETGDIAESSSLSPIHLMKLADKPFWRRYYPGEKKDSVSWEDVQNYIIQKSHEVGKFLPLNIRGCGVWIDKGRVVVNTGNYLGVDGVRFGLTKIKSTYVYIKTNVLELVPPSAYTVNTRDKIMRFCKAFNWKNKTDWILLAGWLMNARICGALDIRPHLHITAPKGAGKSTAINGCRQSLGSGYFFGTGTTTEPGIRQKIGYNSVPIILDEFEANNKFAKQTNEKVVEYLRSSWDRFGSTITKGTAGGKCIEYTLTSAALVSSIRVNLTNDADKSRFCILEILPHSNSDESREEVVAATEALNEELSLALFSRACSLVNVIAQNHKIIRKHIARLTSSQRYGDQVGMLLAGYWALSNDVAISDEQANDLAIRFVKESKDEDVDETSDEEKCLNTLLTTIVDLGGVKMTIEEAIKGSEHEHKHLLSWGIRVKEDRFFIANDNSELNAIFSRDKSNIITNWGPILRRLPGALSSKGSVSFGTRESKCKCVSLPLSLLVE